MLISKKKKNAEDPLSNSIQQLNNNSHNDSGATSNEDRDVKLLFNYIFYCENIKTTCTFTTNPSSQIITNTNLTHYLKMVPILEEIVKRIHNVKKASSTSTSKREKYINTMRRVCSNISFEELDMSNLYSNTVNGNWLSDTNLLSILQLKPLNFEGIKLNHDINEEVKTDIILERVSLKFL